MLGSRSVPILQSSSKMKRAIAKFTRWSNDHACFAEFDPLAHASTFLICCFLQVSKYQPVLPITIGTGYSINGTQCMQKQ